MNKIKGVIFDIGGIFFKDPWEWMMFMAPDSIATQFNLDITTVEKAGGVAWKSCDTKNYPGSLAEQELTYWKLFLSELDNIPSELTPEYLAEQVSSFIHPLHNAQYKQLLSKLTERKLPLAICSNNTAFWFAHEWNGSGLDAFFPKEHIILSNYFGVTKSSAGGEMFQAVVDAVGLPFEELLFIDDRIHNVEKARTLGMQAIHAADQSEETFKYIKESLGSL